MNTLVDDKLIHDEGDVSKWWVRVLIFLTIVSFAGLLYITYSGYKLAPPIPGTVATVDGEPIYTRKDVEAGQSIFLKYGLMNNGSVWGHGAMLGPDYSATALHNMGLEAAEYLAQEQYGETFAELEDMQQASIEGQVAKLFKENKYDPATDTLTMSEAEVASWQNQQAYWEEYFREPGNNAGLKAGLVSHPEELRQFTAFISWATWASVVNRPGENYSYTNNFPYDPLVGNTPIPGTTLWSFLSFLSLFGALAGALLLSGRLDVGWISGGPVTPRISPPGQTTAGQRALVKFFVVVAGLFLMQTLLGGALAHYRIEPDGFYGLPLEKIFPSNLLRTWHMQVAVLWIATAYVAAALFLGTTLRRNASNALVGWANFLFVAFAIVIFGSLLGQWLGIEGVFGDLWFWFGNQGWEFLEMGRAWQYLLVVGLSAWFGVLWWLAAPSRVDYEQDRPLVRMFMLGALAIPVFYIPALFFGAETNFTVVDTWRFWIIHLWVEGYFEFFATAVVALMFYQFGLARRNVALTIIYFDAILYFGAGILGTGHHWYFNGQAGFNMAVSSIFSAAEVVPLTLLVAEAWAFVKTTKAEQGDVESRRLIRNHKWTIYFLMAVGFWNFFGAGVFGFLINLPIVSYFEIGTQLTANHGHAALMGVFGMLALAMMCFVLRQESSDDEWRSTEKWVKWGFWGTNIGLLMMTLMSLFPSGVLQVWDVLENGYWHARSFEYMHSTRQLIIEWLRFPGDMIFIVTGAIPMFIAALKTWINMQRRA